MPAFDLQYSACILDCAGSTATCTYAPHVWSSSVNLVDVFLHKHVQQLTYTQSHATQPHENTHFHTGTWYSHSYTREYAHSYLVDVSLHEAHVLYAPRCASVVRDPEVLPWCPCEVEVAARGHCKVGARLIPVMIYVDVCIHVYMRCYKWGRCIDGGQ
jgi:hypothetical protein